MGNPVLLKSGDKFGKLTVIELAETRLYVNPSGRKHYKKYYRCKCECGNETLVYQGQLICGHTISCGCAQKKAKGLWKSRIYNIYRGILKRCYQPSQRSYKDYGGRGIIVCKEWKNNFLNFYEWAIQNGYSDNLTIDRIDVNGNYEPSNCRWISAKEQMRNRRINHYVTYNNETHCISEWAEILNIPKHRIYQRLHKNWSVGRALGFC